MSFKHKNTLANDFWKDKTAELQNEFNETNEWVSNYKCLYFDIASYKEYHRDHFSLYLILHESHNRPSTYINVANIILKFAILSALPY